MYDAKVTQISFFFFFCFFRNFLHKNIEIIREKAVLRTAAIETFFQYNTNFNVSFCL